MVLSLSAERNMYQQVFHGGNGGKGGSVIFVGNTNLQTLLDFDTSTCLRHKMGNVAVQIIALARVGKDLIVEVPCGTSIYDAGTSVLICDIVEPGQSFRVAEGGKGGVRKSTFFE